MTDVTHRRVVDLTGEQCPMTFVKAKLAVDALAEGDQIEMTLRGSEAIRTVPRTLKADGHAIVAVRREGDVWRLVVEKGQGGA